MSTLFMAVTAPTISMALPEMMYLTAALVMTKLLAVSVMILSPQVLVMTMLWHKLVMTPLQLEVVVMRYMVGLEMTPSTSPTRVVHLQTLSTVVLVRIV